MERDIAFAKRLKYAFERARGIPIETNLAPYLGSDPRLEAAVAACRSALGFEPCEEQLAAAAVLRVGKVAQMQTGEGKTLAAAWMGPLYAALGLSVAAVRGGSPFPERRAAYAADVTYLTARELGFDYLRDGLAGSPGDIEQRPFARFLVSGLDYRADREGRSVAIEETGLRHAADALGLDTGALPDRAKARLFAALHARALLARDRD